jgi:hypothetical protein
MSEEGVRVLVLWWVANCQVYIGTNLARHDFKRYDFVMESNSFQTKNQNAYQFNIRRFQAGVQLGLARCYMLANRAIPADHQEETSKLPKLCTPDDVRHRRRRRPPRGWQGQSLRRRINRRRRLTLDDPIPTIPLKIVTTRLSGTAVLRSSLKRATPNRASNARTPRRAKGFHCPA